MSNKTICDNCKKTKTNKTRDGWFNISVDTSHRSYEEYGLKSTYNRWDLCPKCSNYKIPKILITLNEK
ncbi:MAG: hypothetical protein ABIJ23_01585 [Candidatus Magasanikbacteria bacterium]